MNSFKTLFFILLMCFEAILYAQEWTPVLSPQQINDLVDTGDELLLATDAGLVVMNKTTLEKTIFNTSNSNIPSNHIQAITLDPNGLPYIGTYDMVMALFDGSDFSDFITPDSSFNQHTELYDIEFAQNGDIWIGTSIGVFHRQEQNWSLYGEAELGDLFFEVWDIEIDQSGNVYAGAQNGVLKLENDSWTNISEGTSLQPYLDSELYFSQNGDLFVAADLDSIARYDGENWQLYEIPIGTIHEPKFTEDSDGYVYIVNTPTSILMLEGDTWIPHTNEQTALYGENFTYYYVDNQNVHWLSHNIYLSSNDNGNIQTTSISPTSIEYNKIYSIEKDINGNMYFLMVTSTNSIAVYSPDGSWSYFELPTDDPWWAFWNSDILYRAADDIWVSSYEGLYHFDGSDWSFDELGHCKQIVEDSNGKIYVAKFDRIYIIEDGQISEYNESNSELNALEAIAAFGIDAADNLWIGSHSWDYEYIIQTVSPSGVWTTYDGVDHEAIKRPSGDFHFDINGNVWVSSDLAGVIKFDGQEFTNPIVEHINDLSNYNAFAVESDAEGRLYFAHQYGITTLLDGEWQEWFIEGVPHTNSSISSTIRFDDAGTLWWGSKSYGVFTYTPEITTHTPEIFFKEGDRFVYPNPANQHITLDFEITKRAKVSATMYNNLGQQVAHFDLGECLEGRNQQGIDVSHFARGFYMMRLKIDETFYAIEMILK